MLSALLPVRCSKADGAKLAVSHRESQNIQLRVQQTNGTVTDFSVVLSVVNLRQRSAEVEVLSALQ